MLTYRARQPRRYEAPPFKCFLYPTNCTVRLLSKLRETEYSCERHDQQDNPGRADAAKLHTPAFAGGLNHRRLTGKQKHHCDHVVDSFDHDRDEGSTGADLRVAHRQYDRTYNFSGSPQ